jgi:hypothetical protein
MAKVQIYTTTIASVASYTGDISIGYGEVAAMHVACPQTITSWCITSTGGFKIQSKIGSDYLDVGYFDASASTRAVWNIQNAAQGTYDVTQYAAGCDTIRLKMSNAATQAGTFYVVVRTED